MADPPHSHGRPDVEDDTQDDPDMVIIDNPDQVLLRKGGQMERHEKDPDDFEVYPRQLRSSSPMGDIVHRYDNGAPKKDLSRYGGALKHAIPFRRVDVSASGPARIDEAGLFSFMTYGWVFRFLLDAFKGNLPSMTYNCSIFDGSHINSARLEILWNEELKNNPTAPSLFKVVYRFMSTRLWTACAVFLFCLVFGFIGPTCLVRGLVAFAEEPTKSTHEGIDYVFGLSIVCSLLLVELCRVLSYGATWAVSYRTGIRVRGAVLGLLYKKLVNSRKFGKTEAEIVNIFANDGQRLFDAVTFAPLVLVGPLVLFGGIGYLVAVIGWWSLAGISVFLLFDVIQYGLGMTMVRRRKLAVVKTEERVSLMGEIIKFIRVIKMNAWEKNFVDRIEKLRYEERFHLVKAGYAQSLAIACGPVVPVVAAILTFLGVVLTGNDLLASDAFSAITVFFVMLFGIRMIPYGSRYLGEALVALKRISLLLQSDQWEPLMPMCRDPSVAVKFKNSTFNWSRAKTENETKKETAPNPAGETNEEVPIIVEEQSHQNFQLYVENMVIKKKELIGVCGPVGSGKSALLTAIIGHMDQECGELELGGSVAYVPQTPWIQNASFEENIVFGHEFISHRYQKVLNATQLQADMTAMKAAGNTEIGERGATLSGGQKARVSLARALYANRDLYLLDDVLASVDRKVAHRIYNKAIKEYLTNKTVIMVSSKLSHLRQCDRILFMESGRIVATGTHEELSENCPNYLSFCEVAHHNDYFETRDDAMDISILSAVESDVDGALADGIDGEKKLIEEDPSTHVDGIIQDSDKVVDDEEDFGLASLSWNVYQNYVRAAGSVFTWILLLFGFVLNVGSGIFATYWLSRWLKRGHSEELIVTNGTEHLISSGSLADSPDTPYYSAVYAFSLAILFLSGLFKAMMFVKISLNAATRLHTRMFDSLIHGTAHFFDTNPSGRILNRFSKDMDEIDVKLPFSLEVFLQNMITCVGFMAVIAWIFPYFLLACIPLFGVFVLFVLCFRAGIRSLKRSENISRSPLFDHITSSLEGLPVIHAFGQTTRYFDTLKARLDANSGSIFMFQSAMRWLAVWLDLLVVAVTFIVALCIVFLTGKVSPADAGMAISFAIQMSGIFQFAVRTQTELEAKMTSVERVQYYIDNIERDGQWDTLSGIDVPPGWPSKGQIDFQDVKLRYRPNMERSLHGITFTIHPKEKVGVIGRTGSGKSSLANVLYRLYTLSWGKIYIDGVDISTIGLHTLRRSMAIIPQDPVMFSGSIRYNLDPSGIYSDVDIWDALEKTFMKDRITLLDGLDSRVHSGGDNFSVGERQLLCLARALLLKNRIVVLDEATASLDSATDHLIHKCLKECLSDCTVILIAHKLENINGCDRVILMDSGKLVKIDKPSVLIKNTKNLKKIIEENEPLPEELLQEEEVAPETTQEIDPNAPELQLDCDNGSSDSAGGSSQPEMISTPASEEAEVVGHPDAEEKQSTDSEPEIIVESNESESPEMVEIPHESAPEKTEEEKKERAGSQKSVNKD